MARKAGHGALARTSARREHRFIDPRLNALYAYWDKERGGRPLPSRTDIDPADLRFILGHLVLVDVLRDPLRFRIRLQGTELEWWMGGNLTGQCTDRLRTPGLVAVARKCLTATVESRAPFHQVGEEIIGDLPRRYEALLLPLASDGINVNMVLAGVLCREDRSSL
ncbi:MAG TPA: PAS domain-containing protein [Stellaceae bacterium]|nr:PAS domain-containing protein [Stellaceae bacterium]